jgi:hypothetical protein
VRSFLTDIKATAVEVDFDYRDGASRISVR